MYFAFLLAREQWLQWVCVIWWCGRQVSQWGHSHWLWWPHGTPGSISCSSRMRLEYHFCAMLSNYYLKCTTEVYAPLINDKLLHSFQGYSSRYSFSWSFSCDQAAPKTLLFVCLYASTPFHNAPFIVSWIFLGVIRIDKSGVHAKGVGQRSKVKFTEVKTNFAPVGVFLDCNYSLNSQMTIKRCTKLAVAKEMCFIIFQGHLSNF